METGLIDAAKGVAAILKARGQTLAVAESSSGGLISAALLAVPGASAYFLGGAVVYTAKARMSLMGLTREAVAGMRSSSEPYALLLARTARENLGATWGLSETGKARVLRETPTVTRPATAALPWRGRWSWPSRWKRAMTTAPPIWTPSPSPR